MLNLDGVQMYVSSTGPEGVVGAETTLRFTQKGSTVFARYSGGSVSRGCLIGKLAGPELAFRYAQREVSGEVHGGRSVCEVTRVANGRLRIVEHFRWDTRLGSGINVFDDIVDNREE